MKLIDADELEYMQIGTNAYVRVEDILSATPIDAVPREIEQANKQAAYVRGYKDGQKDKYGQWMDAVPVRHGHWIEDPDDWEYQCSECRHLSSCRTVYCSVCGAKMDGKI